MNTLYEQIGGHDKIQEMVTAFYRRVLGDPLLAGFFDKVDIEKLKRMQISFFTIALGGGEPEQMPSLREAHNDLKIERSHLTRFTELLVDTLGELGISEDSTKKVYERISTYSNEILGESTVDG